MKWGIGVVLCIFTFLLISIPVAAQFEVPEGAITFDSLGLSKTYYDDTIIFQTKEVTLSFAEPSEINVIIYTFRTRYFYARIYVNELLANEKRIPYNNQETTLTIPGAFIQKGENTIYLEFIDDGEDAKFSGVPLTIAPKSYILSIYPQNSELTSTTETVVPTTETVVPTTETVVPTTETVVPTTETVVPTTEAVAPTRMETLEFAVIDIQKSSETSPDINIENTDKQKLSDTTVLLSGSASSDSGIKSVTVNGQYAGTENWNAPVDISGDGNIVIIATGNDGNTTIQNISPKISSTELEPESGPNVIIVGALITAMATLGTAFYNNRKKRQRNNRSIRS